MQATNNASYAIHSRTDSGSGKRKKRTRKQTEAPRQRSGFRKAASNMEEVKRGGQQRNQRKQESALLPLSEKSTTHKKLPTRDEWKRS